MAKKWVGARIDVELSAETANTLSKIQVKSRFTRGFHICNSIDVSILW